MKVCLRTISGISYSRTFKKDDTVQDALSFLMGKLTINDDKIFLISFQKNKLFYEAYEKLEHTGHKNFAFINLSDISKEQSMQKSKMAIPSANILSTIKYLKNNKIGSEERKIHDQYSSTLRREPKDLQNRINQLAQLGYDHSDCLEALRQNNYNVNLAAQYIAHIFSNSFYRKPKTLEDNANKNYIPNGRWKNPKEKKRPISKQKKVPPPINLQKQKTYLSPRFKSPQSQNSDKISNKNTMQQSPPREILFTNHLPTRNSQLHAQKYIIKNQTDESNVIKNDIDAEIKPTLANDIKYSNPKFDNQNRPPKPPLKRYNPKY